MREIFSTASAVVGLVLACVGGAFLVAGTIVALAVEPRTIGILFVVVGILIADVGAALVSMRYLALRARKRLLETGVATTGTLVDVRQNFNVRVNRQHPWIVEYEYLTFGQPRRGKETMFDLPFGYAVGAQVQVRYHPSHFDVSALVRP